MNGLPGGSRSGRIAFVTAAVLVRSLDAGATIGVILIALSDPSVANPVRLGAVVGAALTVPHVLGPWVAQLLARVPDARVGILAASAWFAGLLTIVALSVGHAASSWLVLMAALAGFAGPALTGGLSSLAASSLGTDRRSSSWDALTYGVSGTLAPALVAGLAVVFGATTGVVVLAGLGVVGGVVVLSLPRAVVVAGPAEESAPGLVGVARFLFSDPRMRVVTLLTWSASLVTAAALIAGIAGMERVAMGQSGLIPAALGLGGLLGAAVLIRRPLGHRPDRGLVLTTLGVSACCLVAAVIHGRAALVAVFVVLGLVNAAHTVFSLAGRQELAPPPLRSHVFVTLAGTKVAFASLGTAAAGVIIPLGSEPLLLGLAVLAAGSALAVARLRT